MDGDNASGNGCHGSGRPALDAQTCRSCTVGATTADRYSRIAASLRAKGRRIPTNHLRIAAHAMDTGADLVSAARHFEHVDGIAWIRLRGERRPIPPTV